MINNRLQIKTALETLKIPVKMAAPEGKQSLPFITYAEITNVNVSKWVDRNEYQIDIYTNDFTELLDYSDEIDKIMFGIGYSRTYITPDTQARVETNLYHKSINYVANYNTKLNNIMWR